MGQMTTRSQDIARVPSSNGAVAPEVMTAAEMRALLARVDAAEAKAADAEAKLAEAKSGKYTLRMKVSEKGAASLYGMGRFPVTLYVEQWEALIAYVDSIRAFLKLNAKLLKRKDDAAA